jgi:hypothetical protein
MDLQAITQMIGSLGFPIVACCAMFWQMNVLSKRHQEEVEQLQETLENNTKALVQLSERLK